MNKKNISTAYNPFESAELARDRLYRFQYVTTALAQAVTPSDIAEIIMNLGVATLHAAAGVVWLVDMDGMLYLAAQKGYSKNYIDQIKNHIENGSLPSLDAISHKKPIFIRSREEREKIYPDTLDVVEKGKESSIAIPLFTEKGVLGVVNLAFDESHTFSSEEQEFLFALMQECAQALDRARLYEEESQKKEELQKAVRKITLLHQVSRELSNSLTPEEMAKIVLDAGVQTIGAFGGEITILSPDKHMMRLIAFKGYPKKIVEQYKDEWYEVPTTKPLLMHDVITSKKELVIYDCKKIPSNYITAKRFTKEVGADMLMLFPFSRDNTVEGVFALFFNKKQKRHINENEIEFLRAIALEYSQAYQRAKIYQEEKAQRDYQTRLIERLTLIHEISNLLSSVMRLEDVLEIILKKGTKILGADGGEISLLSEDGKKFKVLAYTGYPKEISKHLSKMWEDLSPRVPLLMWDAVKEKRTIFLTDITNVPKKYTLSKEFTELTHAKSSAIIPLFIHGKAIGIFYLLFNTTNNFIEEDKEFMLTLAQHVAHAVDRAQIYEKQKQTTEDLRQSEENWKQLVDTIPQIVWRRDKNGRTQYYSKRWEEYTGVDLNEAVDGDIWEQTIHPNDREMAMAIWHQSVKMKKEFELEYRLKSAKGEYRWFLSKALPITDARGKVLSWFGTETDINDQKTAAQEIEKREARFRSLLENSSDAVVLMDAKGKILYSSPSTKRITGYSPEERFGESAYKAIYPKDKKKIKKFIQELSTSSEEKLVKIQYRRINKDGSIPWMEAVGRNLLGNANVGALVVNYRNVTEQVEAERMIRQAKDELETILENVGEAIMVWNAKGNILYANTAAVELNRFASKEELLEEVSLLNFLSHFRGLFDENGKVITEEKHPIMEVMKEGKPSTKVLRVVFREGEYAQWRLIKAVPIPDSQGNLALIVVVVHDITKEKEQELVKDEFISTASHELKTPITSAKLYSGMLHEKLQHLGDEKTYAMIIKLDKQLDRLTRLINDLLDVSKMKAGKMSFIKEPVSVVSLVSDVTEEMQLATITHTLHFIGKSKKVLTLDKERTRQVFINLLANAIKYSPRAKKIDITVKDQTEGVLITIQDYGVGIEKADLGKIFEPFYRSDTSRFPGLGLGLHISHEIVKRQGGNMRVESTPGKGTKMFVFFPFKK